MDAKLMNDPDFLQKLGDHIKNNIHIIREISAQKIAERKKAEQKLMSDGPYTEEDLYFKIPDGWNADIFREECARAHKARKYFDSIRNGEDKDFDRDGYIAELIAEDPENLESSSFYLTNKFPIYSSDIARLSVQSGFLPPATENSEIIAMHIFKKTGLCTYGEKYEGRANIMALNEENRRDLFDMGMQMFTFNFEFKAKRCYSGLNIMRNVVRFSSKNQLPYYREKLYEMRTGGTKEENLKIQEFFSNLTYYPGEKDFEVLGKKRYLPIFDPIKRQLMKGKSR